MGTKREVSDPEKDKKVWNVQKRMRLPGIEPGSPAWQAEIIPLDHKRDEEGKESVPEIRATFSLHWLDSYFRR